MTDTMTPAPDEQETQAPEEAEPTTPEMQTEETPTAPEIDDAGIPVVPDEKGGKAGEVKKIADDYVIPISDGAISEWDKNGGAEAFKKYAEQIAIGMYPTFAPQIQAGIPTRILLDPYVQIAAQTLGPMMTEPNWADPKWSAALQGGVDPKTGRPVPMNLDEWRKYLMNDPSHGWDKSPQAQQHATNLTDAIHAAFGGGQSGGM